MTNLGPNDNDYDYVRKSKGTSNHNTKFNAKKSTKFGVLVLQSFSFSSIITSNFYTNFFIILLNLKFFKKFNSLINANYFYN